MTCLPCTRSRTTAFFALAIGLFAMGCDNNDPPPALGFEEFASRVSAAQCATIERCSCDATVIEACKTSGLADAEEKARLTGLVNSGTLVYDGAAAATVVGDLEQTDSCKDTFDALQEIRSWKLQDVTTLKHTLVGTLPAGAKCEMDVEDDLGFFAGCKDGPCVWNDAKTEAHCLAFVGEGAACDTDAATTVNRVCRAEDGGEDLADATALFCVPDAEGSATGTCKGNLPNDAACSLSNQCLSRSCRSKDGKRTCAAGLALGSACDSGDVCTNGRCDLDQKKCVEKSAPGGACRNDSDCTEGTCGRRMDGQSVCVVKATKAVGESCSDAIECAGGACVNFTCANAICETNR